jgi:N-acyl-D-amino-acid deacylase
VSTVIRNASIIDGTGTPAFNGELLIEGERIVSISREPNSLQGDLEIDANGLVLAPGFIDYLSHTLLRFFIDKRSLSKVMQGITTEIMGEGETPAPYGGKGRNMLEVYGQIVPSEWIERSKSWTRFSDWLEDVAKDGVGVNIGSFVGGGTLREYVKGMAMGACSPEELEALRQVSREAMEDGAFGVAFALLYPPDSYTSTAELIEVCKAIQPYGGIYVTHIRDEAKKLIPSLEEAVLIGKTANVPIHIYHLKVCGEKNFVLMPQALELLRQAQKAGLDVTADLYPYRASGTNLESALPSWVAEDGLMIERLRDPVSRAKIRAELIEPSGEWEQLIQRPENTVTVTYKLPEHQQFIGKTLAEICAIRGDAHWADTLMDLAMLENGGIFTFFFDIDESNIELELREPWVMVASDAEGADPAWARDLGMSHPRAYGTFARLFAYYVRERKVISLEEAVRRITSLPANNLQLTDRGTLRTGSFADLVIFNPATIQDHATFTDPHQLATGVRDVWINGIRVLEAGNHTGALAGKPVYGVGKRHVTSEHP